MEKIAKTSGVIAGFLCLVLAISAQAQSPRPQPIQSPVVHPDRTVTFNLRAPSATKVELSAQFIKGNQPLNSDGSGMWSITLGPVEPNLSEGRNGTGA